MRHRRGLYAQAAAIFLAGLSFSPVCAFAGFEWAPPPASGPGPKVMAVPAPVVDVTVLENAGMPPVFSGEPGIPSPSELLPGPGSELAAPSAASYEAAVPVPRMPDSQPFQAAVTAAPVAPVMQSPSRDVIQGFGSDIPLALALDQIVPAGHAYAFDPSVDLGSSVSWNGGKPWDQVLNEAVAPLGYSTSVSGKTIWVRRGGFAQSGSAQSRVIQAASPVRSASYIPQDAGSYDAAPMADNPSLAFIPTPEYYRQKGMEGLGYVPSYPRRTIHQDMKAQDTSYKTDRAAPPFAQQQAPFVPTPQPPYQPELLRRTVSEGGPRISRADEFVDDPYAPVSLVPAPPPAMPDVMPVPSSFDAGAPQSLLAPAEGPYDPYEIRYWQANVNESLKSVLQRWSDQSAVDLVWSAAADYALNEPVGMHGTFSDAVTQLLARYGGADMPPTGKLYPNLPDGPAVLVVRDAGAVATN